MDAPYLERFAICLQQNAAVPVFLFCLRARELLEVAAISRLSRDGNSGHVIGYQRREVKRHVSQIALYLNLPGSLLPNSLTLALSPQVEFRPMYADDVASVGLLRVPLPGPDDEKPAWLVDGQQRALAAARCDRPDFPMPIGAFYSADHLVQREMFIRTNQVTPLPARLLVELLPGVTVPISHRLSARQLPTVLCDELNQNEASPFYGMIARYSTSAERHARAVVRDTSILEAITESMQSRTGALYHLRDLHHGEIAIEEAWGLLTHWWTAVKAVFPSAWGAPPSESRLMHGVGIRSMGRLLDRLVDGRRFGPELVQYLRTKLEELRPHCRWTSGTWEGLNLPWNALENTRQDVDLLSEHLRHLMALEMPARGRASDSNTRTH